MGSEMCIRDSAPTSMRRMFAGCTAYDGKAVNVISWSRLQGERAAEGFAAGCRFAPHFLNAIIASLHREFFVLRTVTTPLVNVDLGAGRVTGQTAQQAADLIDAGIQLTGFEIA